jgi:hypothetical protein
MTAVPELQAHYLARSQALSSTPSSSADCTSLLVAAGDLLRRALGLGVDTAAIDRALGGAKPEMVAAAQPPFHADVVRHKLVEAADRAIQAGFEESPADRDFLIREAINALRMRDALASFFAGLSRWESLQGSHSDQGNDRRKQFVASLAAFDRMVRAKARWFVVANSWRRTERDLLNPDARGEAWWFTERADCDDLITALAGGQPAGTHVTTCPDCQRDIETLLAIESQAEGHVSADDLWAYDSGGADEASRRRIEAHARTCGNCATALQAVRDGEEAIDGDTPSGTTPPAPSKRARRREVVHESESFRLVVLRGRTVRILVQPKSAGSVASATALPSGGRGPVAPIPTAEGIEFDLGPAENVEGKTAEVTVQAAGGGAPFVQTVKL